MEGERGKRVRKVKEEGNEGGKNCEEKKYTHGGEFSVQREERRKKMKIGGGGRK